MAIRKEKYKKVGEIIFNKFISYGSNMLIAFGIIIEWGTVKGTILFLVSVLVVLLRWLLTNYQLKKVTYSEADLKNSLEHKILKFLGYIKNEK